MTVRTETRRVFRAERVVPASARFNNVDGVWDYSDEETRQTRTFHTVLAAYRWVAMGALFRRRAAECGCFGGWVGPDEPFRQSTCKWHDYGYWRPVVHRLARIMRHRAKAGAR